MKYTDPVDWEWVPHSTVNSIEFSIEHEGRSITCRITPECLHDQFGANDSEEECIAVAIAHADEIRQQAMLLATNGLFQGDGTISLVPKYWPKESKTYPRAS